MDEVEVVEVQNQKVLGIRKTGSYKIIAELIPKLCSYASEKGVEITGAPVFVCHEKDGKEAEEKDKKEMADVEIAVPVSKEILETDEIKFYELPGGKMAKILHKGPYHECGKAYTKLFEWIQKNGKKVIGPTREVYLNDPREIKPEEILTEIYAPIA